MNRDSTLAPIITLTTDFGIDDGYVASVKGVILSVNPNARIIDICNTVRPQDVRQASFILDSVLDYFPEGTIHLTVVDPGVGSNRRALIVKTPKCYLIAPDNGVLSYSLNRLYPDSKKFFSYEQITFKQKKLPENTEAVSITNNDFFLRPTSNTFHGRDIFAPVAAHLSLGVKPGKFGQSIDRVTLFSILKPYSEAGNLTGNIIHIDHFGNLITNIDKQILPAEHFSIQIGKERINWLNEFYSEREGLIALIGSHHNLEISFTNGNAAERLNARVGDRVQILV
jgi:S-adenosyl-L-methionine hydrolase (adenosine-forming)